MELKSLQHEFSPRRIKRVLQELIVSYQFNPHQTQQEPKKIRIEVEFSMDLSLATTAGQEQEQEQEQDNIGSSNNNNPVLPIEKEHMFDKVVTPSDVGKLNRLVIPKQHAERYFPLDASSNEKGMLLNFEDRNGKAWRFRYSYWNSSQSYVMTKGWSRFVKEKKLDAGDIVSFQRGGGESWRDRLFIDWRHRPNNIVPHPTLAVQQFNNFNLSFNLPRTIHFGRLNNNCLPDQSMPVVRNFEHMNFQRSSLGVRSYHQHQHRPGQEIAYGSAMERYYMRSLEQNPIGTMPLVIDSVPVLPGRKPPAAVAAAGKRLRLFGVNMECAGDSPRERDQPSSLDIVPRGETGASVISRHHHLLPLPPPYSSSSASSPLQLSLSTDDDDQHAKKGKSSLSFDLDL